MKYFKNVKSYENLKEEYKKLIKANHPDNGGDLAKMQEINAEYDVLFSIWKNRKEHQTGEKVNETAEQTRKEFYTANGWSGSNYDSNLTLKEIAKAVRIYVKEKYPACKFSVRTKYASMCQELHVDLLEYPGNIYMTGEDIKKIGLYKKDSGLLKEDIQLSFRRMINDGLFCENEWDINVFCKNYDNAIKKNYSWYGILKDDFKKVVEDVDSFVNSYNYNDCDGMIDYFDVNFYYFGCKYDNCKIVEKNKIKAKKEKSEVKEEAKEIKINKYTYNIEKDVDTRDNSTIYCVKIVEKLDREEYKQVNSYMRELGGYYSKFKHAFIFKDDPTSQLQPAESEKEDVQPEELENVEKIDKKTEVPQPEPLGDIKNGYNGNDNSNFEKIELEKLINGENVTKSDSWRSCTYCTLPHPIYGNVKLVYNMYNSDLIAGNSLNYCGFIANNNYYCDNNKIMGKLKDDVNRCLIEKIPTELEAERLYQKYDKNNEYNKRDIEACKNTDISLDAAKLFFDDEKPQLILYNILRDIPVETLISYIVEPDRTIEDVANEYMKENSCYIYRQYIMHNKTVKEYNRIINDENSIEQLNKKIMQCINEEKTVRVLIDGIGEIKIDASGVKHIGYTRNISSWHVVASDRDKLKKESKYNYQSIEPQDIKQIKHGNKILYKAG